MEPLLSLNHVSKTFPVGKTLLGKPDKFVHAVNDVSFDVYKGETFSIVGESGCGKSVTSLSIMGLLGRGGAVVDGSVLFANKNLLDMDEKQLDTIRGNQMTMIFQEIENFLR